MTPEQFVERLTTALPGGIKSVVLYGSAAAGDFIAGRSSYNVLVVADRLGLAELDGLAPVVAEWNQAGNEPPLLMTASQIATSADAFPIELADIRQSRKTLFGEDLLAAMQVDPGHLRIQLERELKGKLLSLRRHYLMIQGNPDRERPQRIATLMARSLSTFLVLFRAAVRLFQAEPPARKLDALDELARHISFDPKPFRDVHELKAGRLWSNPPTEQVAQALFAEYLGGVEKVVEAIDRHIHLQT